MGATAAGNHTAGRGSGGGTSTRRAPPSVPADLRERLARRAADGLASAASLVVFALRPLLEFGDGLLCGRADRAERMTRGDVVGAREEAAAPVGVDVVLAAQ